MLLSVIIPLYNCEKYIGNTLNSILHQGLQTDEFEIIVINDGSTDHSRDVVETFANKYSQISIIEQENSGVSAARNHGLSLAKGDYIHFVDGDDQMEDNSYIRLKELTKQNPDLIKFDYYRIEPHYSNTQNFQGNNLDISFNGTVLDYVNKKGLQVSVVFFWIKRKIIVDYKFTFKNYKIGEDGLFCLGLLHLYDKNIISTDEKIYKYIIHSGSTLRNNNKSHLRSIIDGSFPLIEEIKKIISESKYDKSTFKSYYDSAVYVIITHLLRGHFSLVYNRRILKRMRDNDLLSVKSNSLRGILVRIYTMNCVNMWFGSLLHRYIFTPLIKPFLRTK